MRAFTAVKFYLGDVPSHIWGKDAVVRFYSGFQKKRRWRQLPSVYHPCLVNKSPCLLPYRDAHVHLQSLAPCRKGSARTAWYGGP